MSSDYFVGVAHGIAALFLFAGVTAVAEGFVFGWPQHTSGVVTKADAYLWCLIGVSVVAASMKLGGEA